VGPVPVGVNKFTFETDSPDLTKIPNTEIVAVTVVLLSCSYDDREFVRVGYYVNNEYTDEALASDPPAKPVIEKVRRSILAEKPRVTRFAIKWWLPCNAVKAVANAFTGILKNLPQPNTLPSSQKLTWPKTTKTPMGPKRKKKKLRTEYMFRMLKTKILPWMGLRRLRRPMKLNRKNRMKFPKLAARI